MLQKDHEGANQRGARENDRQTDRAKERQTDRKRDCVGETDRHTDGWEGE